MKITNFLKINQIFKPNLVSKYTRMKIYKILARPALAYGSESWTIRSNDRKRLISAEMRFISRTLGFILFDHKRNEELMDIMDKQLKTKPIIDFVTQYRKTGKNMYTDDSRRDTKNDFKIPTKRKEIFRPTPQKMARLCYVMPITGHKACTGKEKKEKNRSKITLCLE
jgi:hypothetical protein